MGITKGFDEKMKNLLLKKEVRLRMPFERRTFGGRFRSRMNLPKPVKVGEEYDVEINEIGSKGDGIARVKNFVVFISGAKKGEKTHIKITEVRNRFAIGKKVETKENPEETSSEEKPTEETSSE